MSYTFAGRYGAAQMVDANGKPLPSTAVTVYQTGTKTLASLYTDRTKATAAANPVSTDSLGNLTFFADPGSYDLTISGLPTTNTVSVPLDPSETSVISSTSVGGDVSGTISAETVAKIEGTAVSSTAPTKSQMLIYNGTDWTPETQVFDVKAYGAKGDGTTDDTTAISDAITAASANGGIVYFPPGNYKITSSLSLPNDVSLVGAGPGASTITASFTTGAMVSRTSASSADSILHVRVADLTLDAVNGPTGTVDGILIDTSVAEATVIRDCLIDHVEIVNARLGVSSNGNNADGGPMDNQRNIRRSIFRNCLFGVIATGTYAQFITDSEFYGCTGCAIGTGGVSPYAPTVPGTGPTTLTTVIGCHVEGLGNLSGTGTAAEHGIYIGSTEGLVANCVIQNVSRYALAFSSGEGMASVIHGITIYGTGWSGIYLMGGVAQNGICSHFAMDSVCQANYNTQATCAILHGTGNWTITDGFITATTNSPKYALGVGGDAADAYSLLMVERVNCASVGTSWLIDSFNSQNGVLNISECNGFRPTAITPGWTLLASETLAADAGSYTFSSVDQTYSHLRVVAQLRSANSTVDGCYLRLNGDSGTNYDTVGSGYSAGAAVGAESAGDTYGGPVHVANTVPGSGATAGVAGVFSFEIPNYTDTTWQRVVEFRAGYYDGATGATDAAQVAGVVAYRSTTAVTSVAVGTLNNNMKTGSRLLLYGAP